MARSAARGQPLLLLLVCFAGILAVQAGGKGKGGKGKSAELLLVQTGERAIVWRSGGAYTLVIRGTGPDLTFFSDRPQRLAGRAPAVDVWRGLAPSADNPVNAALVYTTASGIGKHGGGVALFIDSSIFQNRALCNSCMCCI